jgi:hypothetical protein
LRWRVRLYCSKDRREWVHAQGGPRACRAVLLSLAGLMWLMWLVWRCDVS